MMMKCVIIPPIARHGVWEGLRLQTGQEDRLQAGQGEGRDHGRDVEQGLRLRALDQGEGCRHGGGVGQLWCSLDAFKMKFLMNSFQISNDSPPFQYKISL